MKSFKINDLYSFLSFKMQFEVKSGNKYSKFLHNAVKFNKMYDTRAYIKCTAKIIITAILKIHFIKKEHERIVEKLTIKND